MKPLHAPVLAVHSEPRAAVYRTLLSAPERDWSVSELAAATPEVSGEAARATLYQLLGDLLVKQVPHRRVFRVRLTEAGRVTIREIAQRWESEQTDRDAR